MPQYYLTVPNGITLPANGAKVALSTAAELHRDDSAVPNALTVANGTYNVFFCSDPTSATAAPTSNVDFTVTDTYSADGFLTTHTRTAAPIGTAAAGREILVFVSGFWDGGVSGNDWGMTIGGVTATRVYAKEDFSPLPRIGAFMVYRAAVPSGTTANIVFSRSAGTVTLQAMDFIVARVTGNPTIDTAGATTFTTADTPQSTPYTLDISQTVNAGSAIVASIVTNNGFLTRTWTGATENIVSPFNTGSLASATGLSAGTRTITCQITHSNNINLIRGVSIEIRP